MTAGINYGPFRNGQSPDLGIFPTAQNIRDDMIVLETIAPRIRVFSVAHGIDTAVDAAREHNLEIIPSAFLLGGNSPAITANNNLEVQSLINVLNEPLVGIPFAVVGSEAVFGQNIPVDQLITNLDAVRASTQGRVPLTTAEIPATWFVHPELVDKVDLIFVNIYPYHEDIPLSAAVDHVFDQIHQLAARYPGKPIVLSESGWPSAGSEPGADTASLANQQTYASELWQRALQEDVDFFYFEAFDELWKAESPDSPQSHFGLYTTQPGAAPKGGFTTLRGDVGTALDDGLAGTGYGEIFRGLAGDDTLAGGAGNDSIDGGAGDDVLFGGLGFDVAVFIGAQSQYDLARFADGSYATSGPDGSDWLADVEFVQFDGEVPIPLDSVPIGIAVVGGSGDDFLVGGGAGDSIDGGAGNDVLYALDGSDTVDGEAGDDLIVSGTFAEIGRDFVDAGDGNDFVFGGGGSDTLIGGPGNDLLAGEPGDDLIQGGDGDNALYGCDGNDAIDGGANGDIVFGELGRDVIATFGGRDLIIGDGNDIGDSDAVNAGEGDDVVFAGIGDDTIIGGGGPDFMLGENGHDSMSGDDGDDFMPGGPGNDSIDGGGGDDLVIGESGDDRLTGGAGNDLLDGGAGDDVLIPAAGDDLLSGGPGADLFRYPSGIVVDNDRITDFVPVDDVTELAASLGFATGAAALAAVTQVGPDAVLPVSGGSITFAGLAAATLTAEDFVIV